MTRQLTVKRLSAKIVVSGQEDGMISDATVMAGMSKHFRELDAAKAVGTQDVQAKITEMFENGDDENITVSGTDLLTMAEAIASIAAKIGDNRAMSIIEQLVDKHIDAIESDASSAALLAQKVA
jgi:hypothetical protein